MLGSSRLLVPAVLTLILGSTTASAVQLTATFCNKTAQSVDVAVGYDLVGTDETRSEGWFTVRQCQCRQVISQNVKTTEWWVYVTRNSGGIHDRLSDGAGPLCVKADKFTYRKSNVSAQECKNTGGAWVNFQRIVPKSSPFKLNFGSGGNCRD